MNLKPAAAVFAQHWLRFPSPCGVFVGTALKQGDATAKFKKIYMYVSCKKCTCLPEVVFDLREGAFMLKSGDGNSELS